MDNTDADENEINDFNNKQCNGKIVELITT